MISFNVNNKFLFNSKLCIIFITKVKRGTYLIMIIKLFVILILSISSLYSFQTSKNRSVSILDEKVWKRGDSLLAFLQENMLPMELYYDLDDDDEKLSEDISVGSIYQILRDKNDQIEQVLIPLNEELQLHIHRAKNGTYTSSVIPIIYELQEKKLYIKFNDMFSKDIVNKTDNFLLYVKLEQMFKRSINFKKLKKDDELVAIYTEKRRFGRPFGEQEIKSAMLTCNGKTCYQFLAKDGKYYNSKGKTAQKTFFSKPCRYKRISSRFTKKRWHPVLKRYRAHHGIDYAVGTGTPIHAAYDGKIIFAGKKGGYGNTIVMKHSRGYKSLYAHLSKFKKGIFGKRVKKGEIIGYSGNSGLSTGPHLHFGISLNNHWVNPDSQITFQKGLTGSKRRTFMANSKIQKQKIKNIVLSGDINKEIEHTTLEDIEIQESKTTAMI